MLTMSFVDTYYIAFPSDDYRLKLVVASLFILETTQIALFAHDAFRTSVKPPVPYGALQDEP